MRGGSIWFSRNMEKPLLLDSGSHLFSGVEAVGILSTYPILGKKPLRRDGASNRRVGSGHTLCLACYRPLCLFVPMLLCRPDVWLLVRIKELGNVNPGSVLRVLPYKN